jgi:hypothetical protein
VVGSLACLDERPAAAPCSDTMSQTATWQVRGIVHIVGRVLGRLIEAAACAGVIDD